MTFSNSSRRPLTSSQLAALKAQITPSQAAVVQNYLLNELSKRREKKNLENNFKAFVKAAWPYIDATEYQESWAIDALCIHLEAVADGRIKRLLINFPPRCGKTKVASVCFPAWVWARSQRSFVSGANVRFMCGSYSHKLSLDNSTLSRRLILSNWYQERWAKTFGLMDDQNAKNKFDNTIGGSFNATSVGGSLLGIGGDIILIDDPHNTEQVESEVQRETSLNWWKEIRSTRLNDPRQTAIIVIMQRLHEDDVSGIITKGEDADDWTHLMIPMEYDPGRHCETDLGQDETGQELIWSDPRTEPGELMWPERFGETEVQNMKDGLGPYMASGRLQQLPSPKGGGILKDEYWQVWDGDTAYPPFEFMLASADTAYTEKEENDPSACTVWGIWRDKDDRPKVMLVWAWRKHLAIHGPDIARLPRESADDFRARCSDKWGLVEWLAYTCQKYKVDRLLVEAKASGLSAMQELARLHGQEPWQVIPVNPEGDKVARAHAVLPAFSQGLIYAPESETRNILWAEMVIEECASFPKGRYRDLTDSTTQAIKHLRDQGLIHHQFELAAELREALRYKKAPMPLYPT